MTRIVRVVVAVLASFLLVLSSTGDVSSAAQTFRAAVDVVQLDVSVLDRDRRPVLGLTPRDFTVLVDGQPRTVVAFDAVEGPPPPPPPSAPWMREVAPDVVTNDRASSRLVVIVIDDGSLAQTDGGTTQSATGGPWAIQKMREVARAVVDNLGPNDQAAVLYTEYNRTAQDFTRDRSRLLAAINDSVIFPSPSKPIRSFEPPPLGFRATRDSALAETASDPLGILRGSCPCGTCSIEAIERVATDLGGEPQQRKTLVYISAGVPVALEGTAQPQDGDIYGNLVQACNIQKRNAMSRALRQAQLANVTIQTVDPKGLVVGDMTAITPDDPFSGLSAQRMEFLRTLAETTGGRAIVNRNDMERDVPALLEETRSYYLLGIDAGVASDDGRLHKVEVLVDRPEVEVRTRDGFFVPTPKERQAIATRAAFGIDESIRGPLPRGEVPMDVGIAPFAEPGRERRAALAIVLGVTRPIDAGIRGQGRTERVEVLSAAFEPETGKRQGERRTTFDVVLNPTEAPAALFEVMSRLVVSPGRYQVRLGLKLMDGTTSSVYAFVDVPDFGRDPLTVSGLLVGVEPAPKAAPVGAFQDLVPIVPTARREFGGTDRVTAFARVYRRLSDRRLDVPRVTTTITDTSNTVVAERVDLLPAASWAANGSADYRLGVPLGGLADGEYLLSVGVAAGSHRANRTLRFRVRR